MAISLPSRTDATIRQPHEQKLQDVVNSFTFASLHFWAAAFTVDKSSSALIASPAPPPPANFNQSLRLTVRGRSDVSTLSRRNRVYGTPIFEFFSKNAEEAQIFDDAMTGISSIDGPAVADAYNFEGIHTIVDVAGGRGLLLATILDKNPQLK